MVKGLGSGYGICIGSEEDEMLLDRAKNKLVEMLATDDQIDQRRVEALEDQLHCPRLIDAKDHTKVELVGRIHSTTYFPGDPIHCEAELYDGTDRIVLVFLGRRSIPGLDAGRLVRVRGRLVAGSPRKIFNPWYELLDTQPSP